MRDFVFPMFRANAVYEGQYLLGTSIARPLIAKRLVEIAEATGADAVAHGATGKGNDQVRFELAAYALDPTIKVIAPWREWDLTSRTRLLAYAEEHRIPIARDKRGEAPFSRRREPAAHLLGGQGARGSGRGGAAVRVPAHGRAGGGARHARVRRDRLRARRRGRHRRRGAVAGGAAHPAERARRPARRRPARPRREPLRRHEVARRATRRPAARSCSRRTAASNRSRSTAAPAISRTS